MSDPSIELSLSFLKKVHEDLSLSSFEDNSLFKNLEDSLSYSAPMSHNTSSLKPLTHPQTYPKEISFNVSELSKKSEILAALNNLRISQAEETLPTGRVTLNPTKDLMNFLTPIKLFCKSCEKSVNSVVSYEVNKGSLWNSVFGMFQRLRCCGEGYQDYIAIHRCKTCAGVLARIVSNQTPTELR